MEDQQVPLNREARADAQPEGDVQVVLPDLAYQQLLIVNVLFYGAAGAGDREWILIDTGVMGATGRIRETAAQRFGAEARPAAIILTHGHFDHVGTLRELAEHWDALVYAHAEEHPYLNGSSSYPPPDPTVGGGLMAALARFYPRGPVDVSQRLHALPEDGSVPGMPGWQWLHTPGHTPGHISLWRAADRTLIAGDAFITTRQESAFAVALQQPELHGPPMYYTTDWDAAQHSVERLASLEPELVITGHGPALQGEKMRAALQTLARDFKQIAVPG
ncbi:MAG: MBL fold metallo-hydrolase [Chloroflexaceae bacterium]